jgi:glycine/D-amino acid oxidase-like deaminating enzyme
MIELTIQAVMGTTPDGIPHVGSVPGTENQWILAGFNGGGMSMIFTTAENIADMVLNGTSFEQTTIPRAFKTTSERLSAKFP